MAQDEFPTVSKLWQGAVLATIAHAISFAGDPFFTNELSWDGLNYNRQDSQGARGTVTFAEDKVIGVFFDNHSSRNPFPSNSEYNLWSYFEGIPENMLHIAKDEALQYILNEYKGETLPVITAVFWSKDEQLTAIEPWKEVFNNGARLLRIELMETDKAILEWQEDFELSSSQVQLLESLFIRKMKHPKGKTYLDSRDVDILTANGDEGLDECYELLKGLGIYLAPNL